MSTNVQTNKMYTNQQFTLVAVNEQEPNQATIVAEEIVSMTNPCKET